MYTKQQKKCTVTIFGSAQEITCVKVCERKHCDSVEPLQKSAGHEHILVCVDIFFRMDEAFPLYYQSALSITMVLLGEIFCRVGAPPISIVSDKGYKLVVAVCEIY